MEISEETADEIRELLRKIISDAYRTPEFSKKDLRSFDIDSDANSIAAEKILRTL